MLVVNHEESRLAYVEPLDFEPLQQIADRGARPGVAFHQIEERLSALLQMILNLSMHLVEDRSDLRRGLLDETCQLESCPDVGCGFSCRLSPVGYSLRCSSFGFRCLSKKYFPPAPAAPPAKALPRKKRMATSSPT